MKSYFLPRTIPGKSSAILTAVMIGSFAVFWELVASGQQGGLTFFSNMLLAVPMLVAGVSGIAAFAIGLLAMIRFQERSVLVYITTAIGLFVLIFALAEILNPH